MKKTAFVTVGTTKFDALIKTVCEENNLLTLKKLGFTDLLIQTGQGDTSCIPENSNILRINHFTFTDDFLTEVHKANLVISHAGAGTCLEVLKQGVPLLVVINEDLMNNHQVELAQQLEEDGYVYCCTCKDVENKLKSVDFNRLKPYPKAEQNVFSTYLDKVMGFVS